MDIEKALSAAPFDQVIKSAKAIGVEPRAEDIVHHFSDGVYAKQMHIPAGHVAVSHRHSYSHLSILAAGSVKVRTPRDEQVYVARGFFPAPVRVGYRCSRWVAGQVQAWLERQTRSDEPGQYHVPSPHGSAPTSVDRARPGGPVGGHPRRLPRQRHQHPEDRLGDCSISQHGESLASARHLSEL